MPDAPAIPEAAYADPSNNPGVTPMPNVETTPFDLTTLIDTVSIDAVTRRLSTLRQRHAEAVAAVPQAAAAVDDATRAHVTAIANGADHVATKRAALDASAEHQLALEVVDALQAEAARVQFEQYPAVQAAAHAALTRYAFAELAATRGPS